jgi:MazG family protein
MSADAQRPSLNDLADLVAHLHRPLPEGCPWCLDQTHATLVNELIKEAYEVGDAIDRADYLGLANELGDVLLLLVTHAQLAAEASEFTLADVLAAVTEKVVRRHPHVFGDASAASAEEALRIWDARKQQEAPRDASILDGVPRSLPALLRAEELQQRAARVGFDWPATDGVVQKIQEEIDELAAASPGPEQIDEFGDLLFSLTNLARRLGFSPERALQQATDKFARRFAAIEAECRQRGCRPQDLSLEELDALWNLAKHAERK